MLDAISLYEWADFVFNDYLTFLLNLEFSFRGGRFIKIRDHNRAPKAIELVDGVYFDLVLEEFALKVCDFFRSEGALLDVADNAIGLNFGILRCGEVVDIDFACPELL